MVIVAIYGYPSDIIECIPSSIITTSCSSAKYTRDEISIAFGDAYSNQIYAARLDDPATDYVITGPDGWKPESVKIYGYNSKAVTFYYNTFIPSDTWFCFNYCSSSSSDPQPLTLLSLFVLIAIFFLFSDDFY
ncbi:hypothetical protein F8388_011803 [Cannabis sativa]|uniref:Uncharacterized protein n=1 Tax=Cannabis sativa TaxID=3483 RepID=A0A7J6FM48_CANSA|nr:hypothetical protein F8388_011803 [Cannabis sativa]